MIDKSDHIKTALAMMAATGPRDLRAYLRAPGPDFRKAQAAEVSQMIELLLSRDPNAPARLQFSEMLRSWDNDVDRSWTAGTQRNTAERRLRIHQLLKSGAELARRVDSVLPFFALAEPLVIANEHTEWYAPKAGRDYYWKCYLKYLRTMRDWNHGSILAMDNSTRSIVERLSNPEAKHAYASRGLVMGYVQSGKTANFTGVVARAADAGYRLIIILAGTWNILRNQTQRRLDKELLGKELLANDEHYQDNPPADWDEFLSHGFDPADRGYYTWQRLTRPEIDFKSLKAAIDVLDFPGRDKSRPIYDPANLHALPVKLLVVKKHAGIIGNLCKNLKMIRAPLRDLPALIIDDESDQAGINTVNPRKPVAPDKTRAPTNRAIVTLLKLLPRGQYVGYTATPYANALVPSSDSEDLFPRDFIISLERPAGYMGVSDFFDPTTDYSDLRRDDFAQPEIAFIRRVESPHGQDTEDVKRALRSYVLAGAIKLFRQKRAPQTYKPEYFRHHTMLVHTSPSVGQQASLAGTVLDLWNQCGFNTPQGKKDLASLWKSDFAKVSAAHAKSEVNPNSFDVLVPFVSEAISRITRAQKFIQVVNSDTEEAPDFSAAPVWKIIIGGNKLSRGYTIEGLTVSYYRRVASNADTLMQMGRWFGFRPGYRDLVRVFLGVKEGRSADVDLVALFKEVCRMEDRFRAELERYRPSPGVQRITPIDVPPLISLFGGLRPTAPNKMYHAVVASMNFGGEWSQPTLTPTKPNNMQANIEALNDLIAATKIIGLKSLGGKTAAGQAVKADCIVFEGSNKRVLEFLKEYCWHETLIGQGKRPTELQLQIEFLEKQQHGITSWLIVAPQRREGIGSPLVLKGGVELAVKRRRRNEDRGFQVFGEPLHRNIANFLAGVPADAGTRISSPNEITSKLQNNHGGVMLVYPVREHEKGPISVGFELLFPSNNLPFQIYLKGGKKPAA